MLPDDVVHPVSSAVQQLRNLPWAAHALAAGALASGIILWLIGRRVLKPVICCLFGLLGGAIGFVVIPMTVLAGSVSPYVGLGVGAALGALLGLLLYRFSMALGLGLVLGVAAPLSVAAAMSFRADQHHAQPSASAPTPASESGEPNGDAELDLPARVTEEVIRRQIDALRKQLNPDEEPESPAADAPEKPADAAALENVMRSTGERIETFARAVADDVAAGWNQLSPSHRLILTGSAGVGLALGIILGIVLPAWSAGMVTALLGAAIWLTSASWLALAVAAPGSEHLHRPAREWLFIWLAVAALGMGVQWLGLAKRKKKPRKNHDTD